MRVLLFGTYDTTTHPRVATIAEGLRARGADVAECNAPLGLDTAARVDMLAHPRRAPAPLVRLFPRGAAPGPAAPPEAPPGGGGGRYLRPFCRSLGPRLLPRGPLGAG